MTPAGRKKSPPLVNTRRAITTWRKRFRGEGMARAIELHFRDDQPNMKN